MKSRFFFFLAMTVFAAWARVSRADDSPLITAAKNGNLDGVRAAVAAGGDVSAKDAYGYTAAMWAASRGTAVMMQLLIDKGATLPPDSLAYVALIEAARGGRADVVALLLSRKASPNAKDPLGNTALILAAGAGRLDVVQALLAGKALASAQNGKGQTALIAAAQNGFAAVVTALLDAGATANQQDSFGYTALMWAARNNRPDVVRTLISRDADPTLKAKDGMTAEGVANQRSQAGSHAAVLQALHELRTR